MNNKELEKRMRLIEMKLDKTISLLNDLLCYMPKQTYPTYPLHPPNGWPQKLSNNTCSVCEMEFSGAMGYVCPRSDCPSNVTC